MTVCDGLVSGLEAAWVADIALEAAFVIQLKREDLDAVVVAVDDVDF